MDDTSPEYTMTSLLHRLSGGDSSAGSILLGYPHAKQSVDVLYRGRATGRLIGGNLSILLSLLGTRFLPSFDGSILCLEDVNEPPFRIDRALTQLLNLGLLQSVQGFALGIFEGCAYRAEEAVRKQTLRDVILDRLKPLKKPIVMGLPFGHVPYNTTLPFGALATLDAHRGDLILEESGVR
jgi:muramoyltetrapeptide carboxypeptidase